MGVQAEYRGSKDFIYSMALVMNLNLVVDAADKQ